MMKHSSSAQINEPQAFQSSRTPLLGLCNAYLRDDQAYTGIGLVLVSLLVPLCWCIAQLPSRTRKPPLQLPIQP